MCRACHGGRCGPPIERRAFIAGCGAALGAAAAPALWAGEPKERRARVALVFLSKRGSSWPYPEYDNAAREKEILGLLARGCPEIDFVPAYVREPGDVGKAAALKDEVDGFFVYCVTLTWNLTSAIGQIGKLEKPLVVADEYLGGSGMFLVGFSALRRAGVPAVGVATTRPDDLVAVSRCFAGGASPEEFARRCGEVYRGTFAPARESKCLEEPAKLTDIGTCLERFRKSRFLIVGAGEAGREQDFLGATGIHVGFEEFKAICDRGDPDAAATWAERWTKAADMVEPPPESVRNAGAMYEATRELLRRYGTDSVTMNCLGGFARGLLPAYPCLGFKEILDSGGHGVCEAMPDDTVSMLMGRVLTGRPGFVSDPVLDTAKNQIVYAHCMGTTRVFGAEGASNAFRIRTLHNHDPRSACVQSLLPEGYMTTSFRTNVARKELVIHQAKAVGNLDSPRGCRTQLVGEVRGDIGKLFDQWDRFGWHRVTVYGDIREPLAEFAKALGLAVIEEA